MIYTGAGLVFGTFGDVLLNLRQFFGDAGQKVFLVGIALFMALASRVRKACEI